MLASFSCWLSTLDLRRGFSGLSDLPEAVLGFGFDALGLADDAVECCGGVLESLGVVVGRHPNAMIRD